MENNNEMKRKKELESNFDFSKLKTKENTDELSITYDNFESKLDKYTEQFNCTVIEVLCHGKYYYFKKPTYNDVKKAMKQVFKDPQSPDFMEGSEYLFDTLNLEDYTFLNGENYVTEKIGVVSSLTEFLMSATTEIKKKSPANI